MVLYVAVDRQGRCMKGVHLRTYVPTYVDRGGRLMVYVSAVTYLLLNRYCYLLPVRNLCTIFVYSRDVPRRTKTLTL